MATEDGGLGLGARLVRGTTRLRAPAGRLVPVLVGASPFLLIAWTALTNVGRHGDLAGDYAYLELATRAASHGDALVGPYSRYGWNHPGPAMFTWSAPFYRAFRGSPESLGLAAALLHALAIGTGVAAAGRASGRRAAWVVAAASVALVPIWSYSFIDRIWNPYLVLTGIIATGVLAAGVLGGRRWQLVGLVVAASATVQTHVGTAPTVGLFLVAVAVGVGRSVAVGRTPWRDWARPGAAAFGAAAALWAQPVWEQATGHPGNLSQLVSWARAGGGHHGLREVLDATTVQLTLTKLRVLPNVVSPTRPIPPATPARLVLLLGLLAVAAWGIRANGRAGRRFEQHLCVVAILGVVGTVLACSRVEGELEGYLTLPASAVGVLLWTAALLTLTGAAWTTSTAAGGPPQPRSWTTGAGIRLVAPALVVVLALGTVGWMARRHPEESLQVRRTPDRKAEAVLGALLGAVPRDGRAVVIDPLDGPSTSAAGTIANQLERAGVPVHAEARWEHYFGRSRRIDGCEVAVVSIVPEARTDLVADRSVAGRYGRQLVLVADRTPDPDC